MSISTQVVWQISSGPASRSYADIFLKHGVALIGPGDAGPWSSERDDDEFEGGFVRRFANEMVDGNVLLLRTGLKAVNAVGLVVGGYFYANAFDDVNGWDLQHARRVRWCPLPAEHMFPESVFGANPPRCSRVWNAEALDFAERFLNSPPTHWQVTSLPDLPQEEPLLDQVPTALKGLVAQAADLVPLLRDRQAFGEHPSENELVAHFVVPFFRALGWQPERIAVEWRRIDVALFGALPRIPVNCQFVIEAKRLGAGVEGALGGRRHHIVDTFG